MTETARRVRDGHGSDIVRRLIARPIRMDRSAVVARPVVPETFEDESVGQGTDGAGRFERLQDELAIMKAALAAERDEGDALRSRVRFVDDPEPLGAEALAVRERWAALVDDLLRARP